MQRKQGDEYIGQWYQTQHHIQITFKVTAQLNQNKTLRLNLRQLSKKIAPGLFMKITVLYYLENMSKKIVV